MSHPVPWLEYEDNNGEDPPDVDDELSLSDAVRIEEEA